MCRKGRTMKNFKKILLTSITLLTMTVAMAFSVSADTTTDLSSLKVYGVDAAGKKTEIPLSFNPTTYTYDLTVKSNIASIEITAKTADASSKWLVEKQGVNTKMDTGKNLTVVAVTSAAGKTQKYTLNTTKLTPAEDASYKEPAKSDKKASKDSKTKKSTKDTQVKIGKKTMKITSSFAKSSIPAGFTKSTQKYNGKKYTCIKGEVKDLTAFYLYNDKEEGFYIYNADKNEFYAMQNIKVKSRMYTLVNPEKTDGILENYDKKNVTIIDQKVKAWALNEEEGMYLVYAMNWNGDTNLYCYDDNEKCFQRYLVSNDANNQSEAAAKAYNNLQKDYNKLVDKYNLLIKVLCGLVIVIIILIFVCINLGLNRKEKKAKKAQRKNKYKDDKSKNEEEEIVDEDDIDSGIEIDSEKDEEEPEEEAFDIEKEVEAELAKEVESEFAGDDVVATEDVVEDLEIQEEPKVEKKPKKEAPGKKTPEVEEEPKAEETPQETETDEDIKSTMKSLLPDDQDDDEEDDDFEFIDLD